MVVEWAGVPRGKSVSGYRPPPDDGSPASEAIFKAMGAPLRTIRWGRWKLTVAGEDGEAEGSGETGATGATAGEHELYDLESDPGERRNLIGLTAPDPAPAVRRVRPALWDRLFAWQRRTGDPCRLPQVAVVPWSRRGRGG
jgi:hypothetical protein